MYDSIKSKEEIVIAAKIVSGIVKGITDNPEFRDRWVNNVYDLGDFRKVIDKRLNRHDLRLRARGHGIMLRRFRVELSTLGEWLDLCIKVRMLDHGKTMNLRLLIELLLCVRMKMFLLVIFWWLAKHGSLVDAIPVFGKFLGMPAMGRFALIIHFVYGRVESTIDPLPPMTWRLNGFWKRMETCILLGKYCGLLGHTTS